MTERADRLRKELDNLLGESLLGDDGRVLVTPTKADFKSVLDAVEAMPDAALLTEIAVMAASVVAESIVQSGKRPADYWRSDDIPKALSKKLGKALQDSPDAFISAFKATLKGSG